MTTQARPVVPDLAEFGARLALIRWQMSWNQKEAALACRLPAGSWREWELSGRAPRNLVQVAAKIHEATGVDEYWIITGKPTPGFDPDDDGARSPSSLGGSPTGQKVRLPIDQLVHLPRLGLAAAHPDLLRSANLHRKPMTQASTGLAA